MKSLPRAIDIKLIALLANILVSSPGLAEDLQWRNGIGVCTGSWKYLKTESCRLKEHGVESYTKCEHKEHGVKLYRYKESSHWELNAIRGRQMRLDAELKQYRIVANL